MAKKSVTTCEGGGALVMLFNVAEGFHSQFGSWPQQIIMPAADIGHLAATHLTPEGFARLTRRVRLRAGLQAGAEGKKGKTYSYLADTMGTSKVPVSASAWLEIDPDASATPVVPRPGYTRTKPLYPVCRELPQRLGEQDAYINLTEVALRFLEKVVASSGSGRSFGNAIASQLQIPTEFGQWDLARGNGHLFSITQVMTVADSFLRRLGREYRFYKGLEIWKAQEGRDQLDALQALYENLTGDARKGVRNAPEYDLVQYFRAVRNRLIHGQGPDLDTQHAKLLYDHKDYFKVTYGSDPSKYGSIGSPDFLMLTRAIKYYARVLNDACDLTPADIVAFHVRRDALELPRDPVGPTDGPWLADLRKAKGSVSKIKDLVRRFDAQYALSSAEQAAIEDELVKFLSNDPPQRERRRAKKAEKESARTARR